MYEIDLRGGSVPQIQEEVVITPSTEVQYAVPQMPYNAFAKVTVNAVDLNNQTKTVNSSTNSQTVEPDSGYTGLDSVTVNPVTSSIDPNIQAENIKKDVSILGVNGTLEAKEVEPDVVFMDYDGSILYGYTKDEFLALTELPANVQHQGLTTNGWNWTLEDAKTFVGIHGGIYIGQLYTLPQQTSVYLDIPENGYVLSFTYSSLNDSCTIDWGDGNTETFGKTGTAEHTYAIGNYEMIIDSMTGATICDNSVTDIRFNSFGIFSFSGCHNLSTVILGKTVGDSNFLSRCPSLKGLVIPSSTRFGNEFCSYSGIERLSLPVLNTDNTLTSFNCCTNLKGISVWSKYSFKNVFNYSLVTRAMITVENRYSAEYGLRDCDVEKASVMLGDYNRYFFDGCKHLNELTLHFDVFFQLSSSFCSGFHKLQELKIPEGFTKIGSNCFYGCRNLSSIDLPSTLTEISSSAFGWNFNVDTVICRMQTPCTLGTDVFSNTAIGKIYVPQGCLEAYQTATTWSNYADKMIEMS